MKRTVTLQENNEQLVQSIWRNVEIKTKIVNDKMVIKLLFRNLFQVFVEVIVFSESG